jgi:replicative DNA helicase Mcm
MAERTTKSIDPMTDGSGMAAPDLNSGLRFKDYGSYGLKQYGGWIREDTLPELQGRQGARAYREMLDNSATVGAMMFAIQQAMRRVNWRVDPASDKPEAQKEAEFVDSLRDDMCYDDQTEILTEVGWKLFKDLLPNDRVAQRGADGFLEYVKPIRQHCFDFDGDLMGYQGDAVDFLVTPTHRMLFADKERGGSKDSFSIYKCQHIYNRSGWVTKQVQWRGTSQAYWRAPRWLELLGFFAADGCASGHQVYLIQKERAYVDQLLADVGLTAKTRIVNGATQWMIGDKCWCDELRTDFGVGARNRKLPVWLKELPPEELRTFLRGFAAGDGWQAPSGLIGLYTASKQLADDLQEIAMKAGYVANVSSHMQMHGFAVGSTQYRVGIWSDKKDYLRPLLKRGRGWYKKPYLGKVYCVSVPAGVVLVRRNGKALWCGNSHTWDNFMTEALSMLGYG